MDQIDNALTLIHLHLHTRDSSSLHASKHLQTLFACPCVCSLVLSHVLVCACKHVSRLSGRLPVR